MEEKEFFLFPNGGNLLFYLLQAGGVGERKLFSSFLIFRKSTKELWITGVKILQKRIDKASKIKLLKKMKKETHIIHIAVDKSCG
mgnify:CR=1 FL=1